MLPTSTTTSHDLSYRAGAACHPPSAASLRLLMYGHDTYGLGHLRRSLAIASHLGGAIDGLSTLLLTGSPVAHYFDLPAGADYIKMPSVVKLGDEQYRSRELAMSTDSIGRLRTSIVLEAATHFAPDIVLVDHAPLGAKGELLPALRHLRQHSPDTRIVLGLRDVLDEPERVRAVWQQQDVYSSIEEFYDLVMIYGQADIFDPIEAYGFSGAMAAKTVFTGYVKREDKVQSASDLRAQLDLGDEPFVLVTAGGGGDGFKLQQTFLEACAHLDRGLFGTAVIITGPLMSLQDRSRLEALCAGRPVRLLDFHPDLPGLMRASALVVAMGGYNTVCEILAGHCPALIVPRSNPRLEQDIRARAFAERGLLAMLPEDDLNPLNLAAAIATTLGAKHTLASNHSRWNSQGLPCIAAHVTRLGGQKCADCGFVLAHSLPAAHLSTF